VRGDQEHADPPTNARDESARFRTTVTLTEQELNSLDELRVHFRTATKRSIDRSEIIRDAIRHYYQDVLAR